MLVRGTRHLFGEEAAKFRAVTNLLIHKCWTAGYSEFIPSALAEQEVFAQKMGEQVLGQMYTFKDKGDRDLCLIPEVTALVRDEYWWKWERTMKKPVRVYYLTRCYRYERPQAGRYREFWQFGVEHLGGKSPEDAREVKDLLWDCLTPCGLTLTFNTAVKRGLAYYVEDGFEVECPKLGAQKQIAGGGRYDCGIGWAIGVDRLLLALEKK